MKKDQKFLDKLDLLLIKVSKKEKKEIISKYRNLIDEELKNKKKILTILKEIGTPEEVAFREIELLKQSTFLKKIFKKKNIVKKNEDIIEDETEYTKEMVSEIKEEERQDNKEELDEIIKDIKKTANKKNKQLVKKTKKTSKKVRKSFKEVVNNTTLFFETGFSKFINVFKKKEKAKDIEEKIVEEVNDAIETVSEKKIFESKKKRIIRITLQTLGLLIVLALLFVLLWSVSIFVASLFALLDGVKFYGINIALLGITLLIGWLFLIVNNLIFKKKIKFKLSLISIIIIVAMIGSGVALSFREYYKVSTVDDVSEKYSMNTSYETYNLFKDATKKSYISFNSNYKTKYIIEYDNTLSNKYKIEIKYYESYYDLYIKKSSNNIYISLSTDFRDLLSVYIDNLKDGKVFNMDELSRYTVRIIMNEADKNRIIIE